MNSNTKTPDGQPDWKQLDQYPNPEHTSLRAWAWEFLRRNPKYIKCWDERIGAHYPHLITQDSLELVRNVFDDYQRKWNELIPPKFHNKELRLFEEEFGLKSIPPPPSLSSAHDDFDLVGPRFANDYLWFRRKPAKQHWPDDEQFEVHEILNNGDVMVRFSVEWPLDQQLKIARKILLQQKTYLKEVGQLGRSQHRAVRRHLYRDYLRLLDGELSHAAPEEMAKVIFPKIDNGIPDYRGNRKVRDGLKSARRLRDFDYGFIVMSPEK